MTPAMSTDSFSTGSGFIVEASCPLDFSVKVDLGPKFDENLRVRRFQVRHLVGMESGSVSLNALVALLGEATESPEDAPSTFYYEDSDGDRVAVTTTRELSDAIDAFAASDHSALKLLANVTNSPSSQGNHGGGCTIITDPTVTERMRAVIKEGSLDPVTYKDNLVDAPTKAVLTHLVDEFKDHITASFAPPTSAVSVASGQTLEMLSYNINGKSEKSKYFAIDGLYMDLTMKEDHDDTVKLLFPRPVYNKFHQIFNVGNYPLVAGFQVTSEELQKVKVFVDQENPPAFVSMQEYINEDGHATDGMILKKEGILTDVMELESHKHLYEITGIFTVTKQINNQRTRWCTTLTLVGLRAFSIHDNLLEKNNVVNATAFGN